MGDVITTIFFTVVGSLGLWALIIGWALLVNRFFKDRHDEDDDEPEVGGWGGWNQE